MFEKIKALLAGKALIKKAYDDTFRMVDVVSTLFVQATDFLIDRREPTIDIHREDKRINDMEMDIRRDILEHLAVDPQREVSASLILSAVVGYVERIGDYAKNVEELARIYARPLRDSLPARPLVGATAELKEKFAETRKAFAEEDTELATRIILRHRELRKTFDAIVEEMFEDDTLDKDEALACAIYARYLKRISAGLKNVCTTVVVPFDRIGYSRILREAAPSSPEQ